MLNLNAIPFILLLGIGTILHFHFITTPKRKLILYSILFVLINIRMFISRYIDISPPRIQAYIYDSFLVIIITILIALWLIELLINVLFNHNIREWLDKENITSGSIRADGALAVITVTLCICTVYIPIFNNFY